MEGKQVFSKCLENNIDVQHQRETVKRKQKSATVQNENQHKHIEKNCELKAKRKKKGLGPLVPTQTIENSSLSKAAVDKKSENKLTQNVSKTRRNAKKTCVSNEKIGLCFQDHAAQSLSLSEKQNISNKNEVKPKDLETGHAVVPSSDESGSKVPLSKAKKRRLRKKRILQVLGLVNKQVPAKSRKKKKKKCGDSESNLEEKANDSSNSQTEFSNLSSDISTRNFLFEQNSDSLRNAHKTNNICNHIVPRRPVTEDTCLDDNGGHLCSAVRNSYSQGNTLPNGTASENPKAVSENILATKRKQKKEKQAVVSSNNPLSSETSNGILFEGLQNDISLSLNSGNKAKKSSGRNDNTVEKGKPVIESVSKLPKTKEKEKKITVSNRSLASTETSSCDTASKVSGKTLLPENTVRILHERKKEPIGKGFPTSSVDNTDSLNVRVHTFLPETEGKIIKNPLCDTELPSALSLQRSVLISGPIYTSPNFENRVTSSAESNQIFNISKTSSVLSSSICSAAPVKSKESDNSHVKIQNTKPSIITSKSPTCRVDSSGFCVNEHFSLTDKKCEKTLLEEKAVFSKSVEKESHISIRELKQSPLELQEISKETAVSSCEKKNLPLLTKKENTTIETTKGIKNTPVSLVEADCGKSAADNCLSESSSEPLTMPKTDKTREEIKAEREARKLAKQAKKSKVVVTQKQPTAAQTNDAASTSSITAEQANVVDNKQIKKSSAANTVQLQHTEVAGSRSSKLNAAAAATEKRSANDPQKLPDGTSNMAMSLSQSCVQADDSRPKVNTVGEKPNKSDALKLADGIHPTVVNSSQPHEQVSNTERKVDVVAQSPNSSDALKLADSIHPAVINSSQSLVQAGNSGHKASAVKKPNTSDAVKLADGLHTSVMNSGQPHSQVGSSVPKIDTASSTHTEGTNVNVSVKSVDGISLTQHVSPWSELKPSANESKTDAAATEHPNASDSLKLVDGISTPQQTTNRTLTQTGSNSPISGVAGEQTNTSDALKLVDGVHPPLQGTSCVDTSDVASGIQAAMAQINDHKARKLPQQSVPVQKRINASDDEKVKERSVIMKQKTETPVAAPSTDGKSKAELRAERRAKQEAQRAAKLQNQQRKSGDQKEESKSKADKPPKISRDKQQAPAKSSTASPVSKVAQGLVDVQHKVKLFNHLYLRQKEAISAAVGAEASLHPAIVRLGIQYKSRVVTGSNARCVALLHAIKQVIEDFHTPSQQEFSRGLESSLRQLTTYLHACRPLPVSATNALRHLKWQLTLLPNNVTDSDAKKKLHDSVDTYIREQIDVAGQAICNAVLDKITNGDTILTYGCSSLLTRILLKAHDSGKRFHVVVADGRPWLEGREMLRRLVKHGLKCSYVLLPAASFIMREATKVLLGAHALLANGYVMSRAGASQIALLAHTYNVPVLVCCETHKFSERVQTDSFVYNELGDPDALGVRGWHEVGCLTPLNLTYDVTPPDLVTAVVTELAILPCTSVPVILRIKPSEAGF
ncbi:uncharacterized protein LOC126418448 isoform X1 [Schistocerca serialis cubense]|uniref:uncharacterized protein LOC126418448 isoform X1 n=1 Tax=Schistocerca serialis cubense TaxID=2023355 RepID=UPI00214F0004|nr:uncharacterized protein LOC126418448 isoform X1 [Schistocerca serialis cubense]